MPQPHPDLFGFTAPAPASALPEGFAYRPETISRDQERALAARFEALPFRPYAFRGFLGQRQTVSFGWRYADDGQGMERGEPIPLWLEPVREQAAAFAGIAPDEIAQAMVIQYPPGAPIGWHRDRPAFEKVMGVSLLTPAPLRLRLERPDGGWDRFTQALEPRSAYLMSGPARHRWQHSIPPLDALRYSITFRSLRPGKS